MKNVLVALLMVVAMAAMAHSQDKDIIVDRNEANLVDMGDGTFTLTAILKSTRLSVGLATRLSPSSLAVHAALPTS